MHVSTLVNFLMGTVLLFSSDHVVDAKKDKGSVVSSDLPLIACDVCQQVMTELCTITQDLREKAAKKKLEEILISEAMDNVCDDSQDAGTNDTMNEES